MMLIEALAAYALSGTVIAVAFVSVGVRQVLPQASVTPGARLLLLPAAIVLWPFVLGRWLKSGQRR
jgi:hypothetical protein